MSRYSDKRIEAVKKLGGKCASCSSEDGLQFDHIDRATKEHEISDLLAKAGLVKLYAELAKCQLLCRPCHKAKSREELSVPHGGGSVGVNNCDCQPCKDKKREYMRAYHKNRQAMGV